MDLMKYFMNNIQLLLKRFLTKQKIRSIKKKRLKQIKKLVYKLVSKKDALVFIWATAFT